MSHAPTYERYADFYQAQYGTYIRRLEVIGPITLIDVQQTAGDFSDEPVNELVVVRVPTRGRFTTDFGNGLETGWTEPGDIVVGPPNFATTVLAEASHRCQAIAIDPGAAQSLYPERRSLGDFGRLHSMNKRDHVLDELFDKLAKEAGNDRGELSTGELTVALLDRLDTLAGHRGDVSRTAAEALSPRVLTRAIDRLSALEMTPPSLGELASMSGLSPSHFCRAFRASTGLPPHRFQIVKRIERARDLLLDQSMSIANVAQTVGYDDPAYFCRLFTRETGVTPSRWRQP